MRIGKSKYLADDRNKISREDILGKVLRLFTWPRLNTENYGTKKKVKFRNCVAATLLPLQSSMNRAETILIHVFNQIGQHL